MKTEFQNLSLTRSNENWHKYFIIFILALSLSGSALAIFMDSGSVPAWPLDQSFANVDIRIYQKDGHWQFHYPRLQHAGGITASLLIGLYKLIFTPSDSSLNWHVRIFSMIAFLGSSHLLVTALIKSNLMRAIALILIATTGFQFIQPSSEIIAGSFFSLFLTALARKWHPAIIAFFLIAFGFCKVELTLCAIFIGLYWIYRLPGERRSIAIMLMFGFSTLFLFPGLVVNKLDAVLGSRGFESFSQHYSALVAPLQFNREEQIDPWINSNKIMSTSFPGVSSVKEIILNHSRQYFSYLALSLMQSMASIAYVFKLLIFTIILSLLTREDKSKIPEQDKITSIAFIISIIPAIFFAFVHIRYAARFYPAIICSIIAGQDILERKVNPFNRKFFALCALGTIGWQIYDIPWIWNNSHGL